MYTGWVGCVFECSPHEVCIAFCTLFFQSTPHHFLGNNRPKQSFQGSQWLHWDKVTRFIILNVEFPMLSEIQPSNPLTRRSVPLRWFSLPIRCLPSVLQKCDNKAIYESSPKGGQTCHARETLRFLPHKGCSQVLKRCQIPNAVWDGASQLVVI